MQTMFERSDGAKILFDHEEQDHLGYSIIYGAIYLNGKTYEPQPVEQLLAHGYWEATSLVKSVSLKYSPDQLRDENGRFTVDGSDEAFARGNWKRMDSSPLVAADVAKMIAQSKADGKELTEKEIQALTRKSQNFYAKHHVYRNGSTMMYVAKKDIGGRNGIPADAVKEIASEVTKLQEHSPLDNVSIHLRPVGSSAGSVSHSMDDLSGTSITLNYEGMLMNAVTGMMAGSHMMPAEQESRSAMFTLAHEWGHAVDQRSGWETSVKVAEVIHGSPELKNDLSAYSAKSDRELYAELYAQRYFEDVHGSPTIPATDAVRELLK